MVGSIWTVAVLMGGAIGGYLFANKKVRDAVKKELPPTPTQKPESGAVQAIKPDEIAKERQKGFINRMEELIDDNPR